MTDDDLIHCDTCGRPIPLDNEHTFSVLGSAGGRPVVLDSLRMCVPCATSLAVSIVETLRGSEFDIAETAIRREFERQHQREAMSA